jgi:EAL domain-containing protein (putative c-di-GMP-specific phosphodiesterase class I)/PleD family two-component response regulator
MDRRLVPDTVPNGSTEPSKARVTAAALMAAPLRVLIVEDSLDDAQLLLAELKRGGYDVTHERVTNEAGVRSALQTGTWDLIISDYSLPGFDGMRCLQIYREFGLDIPFILMSGTVGEEIAVEAMKSGAHDYIMKDRIVRLVPAIQRELREAQTRRERRTFMEHIEFIAYHDPVTRLPNQRLFVEEVDKAIKTYTLRPDTFLIVAVPEISKFKDIRTTVSQADYDALMKKIAERIWLRCKSLVAFARIDEYTFATLFPADSGLDHHAIARLLLSTFEEPFELDPFQLHLDASVGMAIHGLHAATGASLLRNAMVAASQARERHQPYSLYSIMDDLSSPDNLSLVGQLRDAIRNGELVLHYQPIMDLRSNRASSVEALVRWNHPQLGLLPPDRFLGLAESSSLIIPLTAWVVGAAFNQWRQWRDAGLDIDMCINLSVRNIQDSDFVAFIAKRAEELGINPGNFVLEVTESSIMTDREAANEALTRLHDIGFRIAIDDFGTGHSSLSYLQQLPVDDIKVDRNFVTDICENQQDLAIVNAVLGFANGLGKRLVAEGVESGEALGTLRNIGCHLAQGYHISRPMERDAAVRWLMRQQSGH